MQADPNAYCGGNSNITGFALVSLQACHQISRRTDICKRCDPVPNGVTTGWSGSCLFVCDRGYYPSNGTCVACTSAPACPVGSYLNKNQCDAGSQTAPICQSCELTNPSAVSVSWTTDGGFSSFGCLGRCPTGWHTQDSSTGTYVHGDVNGSFLGCIRCTATDTQICDTSCQIDYYRVPGIFHYLSAVSLQFLCSSSIVFYSWFNTTVFRDGSMRTVYDKLWLPSRVLCGQVLWKHYDKRVLQAMRCARAQPDLCALLSPSVASGNPVVFGV